jgi:hypothetical protein
MTAQEGYFIDKDTYTDAVADLTGNYGFVPSDGCTYTLTGGSTQYTIVAYNTKAGSYAVTYTVTGPGGEIHKEVP